MIMEWRLGNISAYFAWINKLYSGVWDWCVDAIVDELESFTLIGFSDGYLVRNIFSGHPDSVLCILSQLLGHLHVVVVGI